MTFKYGLGGLIVSGILCFASIIITIIFLFINISNKWSNVDQVFAFIGWLLTSLLSLLMILKGYDIWPFK
jgi:uncharacterized membrane protein